MQKHTSISKPLSAISAVVSLVLPAFAFAQDPEVFEPVGAVPPSAGLLVVGIIVFGIILSRIWMGIMNVSLLHDEPLDSIERRKPYLPSFGTVVATVACTAGLFFLSLKAMGGIEPFDGPYATTKAAVFFAVAGALSVLLQYFWPKAREYIFAATVGTVITFLLLGFNRMLFDPSLQQNAFFMALGIVCVVMVWRFLFGPWSPPIKATVLGTFIFWAGLYMFLREPPGDRLAHAIATFIALIPAVIWCMLFLKDHAQRMSLVVLMFFAGMLSTAPILYYDAMVRNGVELQFFIFRIVPENFTRTSNAFVAGNLSSITGIKSTLMVTFISFLIVGIIEEMSKFWVLKKSGTRFFSSIDDVLQLSIIVAIGFAFAENLMNPTYFISFVREYLINPDTPQWGGFLGNVLGRAILTNMVHILATGVIGYFYGLALFADPYMADSTKEGKVHVLPKIMHILTQVPETTVFRRQSLVIGVTCAVLLHGAYNFLVTLPDLLPGQPRTVGDLLGSPPDSLLHFIALLIVPSLLYVVGGFWILSILFYKKECIKERGCVVEKSTYVKQEIVMG